ncbi:hypothetical protein [Streptomyces sp. NPDC049881]|uniref:hypothetical protein n=1 Tax=Streptomyces sp. NPDC049881 TaxID=3155778 RepID=UPI00341E4B6A
MERLLRVYQLFDNRGLSCYPQKPLWPDEWFHFVVYRHELLSVNLADGAANPELKTSMDCVMDALRHPYGHRKAPSTPQLLAALGKLGAAGAGRARGEVGRRRLRVAA